MRYYMSFLILAIIALSGCYPSAANSTDEDIGQSATLTPSPIQVALPKYPEAYLLLSSASPPFAYSLVHMPATCLLSSNRCRELETVPQFPSTEFLPSSIHWSPDGSRLLIYNGYSSNLLLVDANTSEIIRTPIKLSVISDQLAWSPDSNWVAISVQGNDEYTSRIVLLDVTNNIVRELSTDLDGTLYPVGWNQNRELLIIQFEYEFPAGLVDQKKVIASVNLTMLDIYDLSHEALFPDLQLRGDSLPSISPNGGFVAISVVRDEAPFLDIYTIEGMLQNTFEAYINPIWSPDGQQIAAILQEGQGYSVYVLDPISGQKRNLFHLASLPELTWFPNSADLVATSLKTDEQGNEKSVMYIISTSNGEIQEINLDDIRDSEQIVLSISFRPERLP